jgi:hypothetical protein
MWSTVFWLNYSCTIILLLQIKLKNTPCSVIGDFCDAKTSENWFIASLPELHIPYIYLYIVSCGLSVQKFPPCWLGCCKMHLSKANKPITQFSRRTKSFMANFTMLLLLFLLLLMLLVFPPSQCHFEHCAPQSGCCFSLRKTETPKVEVKDRYANYNWLWSGFWLLRVVKIKRITDWLGQLRHGR